MHRVTPAEYLLFCILAGALLIRLWGINHDVWIDENKVINPSLAIARAENGFFSISPQSYYPHFSHYILASIFSIAEVSEQLSVEMAHTVARVIMVVFNVATVAMVYVIGKRLMDARSGLMAAALLAFMPLHVKYSHFAQVDVVATFFMVAALWAALNIWDEGKVKWYIWTGVLVGAAGASQYWGFSIGIAILLAHGRRVFMSGLNIRHITQPAFVFGLLAIPITFLILNPYWIIDFEQNLASFQKISARGAAGDLGHTRANFLWPLYNQSRDWGLSFTSAGLISETPILTFLLAVIGILYSIKKRDFRVAVLIGVIFIILYTAISSGLRLYAIKRLMPLGPLLAIAAAYALSRMPLPSLLRYGVLVAAFGMGLWPSLQFSSAYAGKATHGQAVQWAKDHIPDGAVVLQHTPLALLPWNDERRELMRSDQVYANFNVDDPEVSHDRARSLAEWIKTEDVDFVVMDSRLVDRYYDATSEKLYPEATASYRDFYDDVRRRGALAFTIGPEPWKQAGARIEIYDVRGLK